MRSVRSHFEYLEKELQGSPYQVLLGKLQRKHIFLRSFRTWADVVAFMRSGTSTDPRKDEILRPIFEAHSEDRDPRWRTLLLVIFSPALESIHFKKRGWDPDADERWQNVIWAFLQVVCRIDVNRRHQRLVQKIFNDTVHRLYDEYERVWRRAEREVSPENMDIEAVADLVGLDLEDIDGRIGREMEIERLREHLDAGRISEADFLLIVGSRVYGRPLVDYARDAGLDYQLAKKRRQRAEAVIRRFEKKIQ
jgi:hypothetical protein